MNSCYYAISSLESSAEAFQCRIHHYQCLAVPVILAVMVFVFQFIEVGMAEMFSMSAMCDCVKEGVSFVM